MASERITKVKLCGLSREEDIKAANSLHPEYIGFVFATRSKRYVTPERAKALKAKLDSNIQAVGVFVDEEPDIVARLLHEGVIDIAQLHGAEGDEYIAELHKKTGKSIIKAFRVKSVDDVRRAEASAADCVLLDAGAGDGRRFDWSLIGRINRPYFLAGGLDVANVAEAVNALHPYAVDVSSGIETDGKKDPDQMAAFVAAVRKEQER